MSAGTRAGSSGNLRQPDNVIQTEERIKLIDMGAVRRIDDDLIDAALNWVRAGRPGPAGSVGQVLGGARTERELR